MAVRRLVRMRHLSLAITTYGRIAKGPRALHSYHALDKPTAGKYRARIDDRHTYYQLDVILPLIWLPRGKKSVGCYGYAWNKSVVFKEAEKRALVGFNGKAPISFSDSGILKPSSNTFMRLSMSPPPVPLVTIPPGASRRRNRMSSEHVKPPSLLINGTNFPPHLSW